MKVRPNIYPERKNDSVTIEWETPFEESVIDQIFQEGTYIIAQKFANCIVLRQTTPELTKKLQKVLMKEENE
jgi:hypothetical protein